MPLQRKQNRVSCSLKQFNYLKVRPASNFSNNSGALNRNNVGPFSFIRSLKWQLHRWVVQPGRWLVRLEKKWIELKYLTSNHLWILTKAVILITNVKSFFLNHCRSHSNRIKQQKLALPISPTLTTDVSWYCKPSSSRLAFCNMFIYNFCIYSFARFEQMQQFPKS